MIDGILVMTNRLFNLVVPINLLREVNIQPVNQNLIFYYRLRNTVKEGDYPTPYLAEIQLKEKPTGNN